MRSTGPARWFALGMLPVLLLTLLAACGTQTSGNAGPAESEVRVVLRDNVFEPATVKVPAGKAVKVTFVNEGKNIHEVEIGELNIEAELQPGQSRSYTVTPEKKTYAMPCEIHGDKGMVGQFIGE